MAGILTPAAYALTLAAASSGRLPVMLWNTVAGPSDYAADEAAVGYPASNLASPSTVEGWRGTSTDPQVVIVTLDPAIEISAIGLERHNLGSSGATLTIEGVPAGDDPLEPSDWVEIVADHVPGGDGTLMYRFAPDHYEAVRLVIVPDTAVPRLAVFWVGALLTMERGVQPHTPINHAAQFTVQGGRNRAGDFLGEAVIEATRRTSAQFAQLTPGWVRTSEWLAFAASVSKRRPFFFAWDPQDYPTEVGFVRALNNVIAETNHLAGYSAVTIELEGVVS